MPPLVPPFPLVGDPGTWPAIVLLAGTIVLESEGEPFEGMLGVGWVVRRRALDWKQGWHGAMLGGDLIAYDDAKPFEPFSCWGDDYRVRAHARLSSLNEVAATECWRAAAGAFWALLPDPTHGSAFYLNVPLTLRIRKGSLPTWAADPTDPTKPDSAKVTTVIGRHTFLR